MNIAAYRAFLEKHVEDLNRTPAPRIYLKDFSDAELMDFVENGITARQREAICIRFSSTITPYAKVGEQMGVTGNCARQFVHNTIRAFLVNFRER